MKKILLLIITLSSIILANDIKPPIAKIIPDTVKMHETIMIDNYSWMKDKERCKKSVIDYSKAENLYTEQMMAHTKDLQDKLFKEIKGKYEDRNVDIPVKFGDYLYYTKREKGDQYYRYCRKKGVDGKEEIYLNLNELAKGYQYFDITSPKLSKDHTFISFGIDSTGSEKYTQVIKDLTTGEILKDRLGPSYDCYWGDDNKTLYYVTDSSSEDNKLLYKHIVGEDSSKDKLLYEEKQSGFDLYLSKSKNRRFIILEIENGAICELRYIDTKNPEAGIKTLFPREYNAKAYCYPDDHGFYIMTNVDGARNYTIIKSPFDNQSKELWGTYIPHRDDVTISSFELFKDRIILREKKNGLDKIRVIDHNNGDDYYISFPEDVYSISSESNPEFELKNYRYYYSSLVTPGATFEHKFSTKKDSILKQRKVLGGFDSSNYTTKRLWATARDGVKVPISILYRTDLYKNDGSNPMFLYAYGSYGDGTDPDFSSVRLSLVDRGFVYGIAHIRGGDEMGEDWRYGGKVLTKKNTFNDFIDCAQYLVDSKVTSSDKLVASGGSAGGMLMGVIANWRPDLFKVVLASVPACDELNLMLDPTMYGVIYHYNEWGNPNIKKEFDYFYSWDPYYNVKKQEYPHILVDAGLHDPRVPYWAPLKWVAKLRAHKTDRNQLLIKIDMAGHGGMSGRDSYFKQSAFEYAFIFDKLGIEF